MRVAGQRLRELLHGVVIVQLGVPRREIDGRADGHIDVALDIELELHAALVISGEINRAFDLLWVHTVEINQFLRGAIYNILVVPAARSL